MSKKKQNDSVSREHYNTVMKEFVQYWFNVHADLLVLQMALIESGAVTQAQIDQARVQVEQQLKGARAALAETTPEKLLAMLRKFEGPLQ